MILLDGGFVKKRFASMNNRNFPTANDIDVLVNGIMANAHLADHDLIRVYWYDAPPLTGQITNPLDGVQLNLGNSQVAQRNQTLLNDLELTPLFAVRRGELINSGWKLGNSAMRNLRRNGGNITANSLVPDITQKGVDLKIGLDVAWIALKRTADILVLVTGDSDFVPAIKLARKEGLLVYLDIMGHTGVRLPLKAHADRVL